MRFCQKNDAIRGYFIIWAIRQKISAYSNTQVLTNLYLFDDNMLERRKLRLNEIDDNYLQQLKRLKQIVQKAHSNFSGFQLIT
jgi:hypothetical protein